MRVNTRLCQALTVVSLTLVILLNLRLLKDSNLKMDSPSADEVNALKNGISPTAPVMALNCYPYLSNSSAQVVRINMSDSIMEDWVKIKPHQINVIGHMRPYPAYLTIGIPTIKRVNGLEYLMATLESLVQQTKPEQKKQTVVVVFLADFDLEYRKMAIATISSKYQVFLDSGFLQITQVSKDFYPPLENLKRNFNDKAARVTWRSKQVVDFAFMFLYARNLSQYYMQLEDDVITAENYIDSVQDYVSLQKKPWAVLEFSELGFIGKLFKSKDLNKLAQFMMIFYDEQPVDWLIRYFRMSMAQHSVKLRKPTLFQHMGKKSSFDTKKVNSLKDRYFDDGSKPIKIRNPQAELYTNIKVYQDHNVNLAYDPGSGFFWGKGIKQGDAVYVLFGSPVHIKRIFIKTGTEKHAGDVLSSGKVEISNTVVSASDKGASCSGYRDVGTFMNGGIDVDKLNQRYPGLETMCLRILVTETQSQWLIIHQIAVFTADGQTTLTTSKSQR